MGVNKKSRDEIGKEYDGTTKAVMKAANAVLPLLRALCRFEFIKRRLSNTVGGRVGAISSYAEKGLHDEAVQLAFKAVKDYRNQPTGKLTTTGKDYIWFFMRMATESLPHCDDQTKWDEALEIARSLEIPQEDYEGAAFFLNFSRWKYETDDYEAAIELAEIASGADSTWGEPDFILGWYDLALGGGNPMEHFKNAVHKDEKLLFRIMNEPVCKRHPHILEQLKALARDQVVVAD